MDKVFKVEERLVSQKFIELPVSYAAELFAMSCRECFSCILQSSPNKGQCPFDDKECRFITREDWEEYLNG